MDNNLSPIIVFCYNRPGHVEQTLEALSHNDLADQSVLYIYCDGPKDNASDEQKQKILDTRVAVRKKKWCKEIYIVEAEKNKGLARSIIDGVTEVVRKHGRVIVLEDDLVSSPYLIRFMNMALDFYENRKSIMSISANRPPVSGMSIPQDYQYDVFFSLRPFSTGWATWADRWLHVDWGLAYLSEMLQDEQWVGAFNRGGDDLTEMLCLQEKGRIDSWAIRWAYAHFYEHCLAVLPCIPYVDNIGFDGTGTHSGDDETDFRNNVFLASKSPRLPDVIYEDARIINSFANYYSRQRRPLWKKVCNWFARKLGKTVPFPIKKKIYA